MLLVIGPMVEWDKREAAVNDEALMGWSGGNAMIDRHSVSV